MSELKPCPFCGDRMRWLEKEADAFTHTFEATESVPPEERCYLRHTYYHGHLLEWWNTRASNPQSGERGNV